MALIGYARVSMAEQDTALQTDALRKGHCCKNLEVVNLLATFADGAAHEPIQRPAFSA